MMTLAKFDHKHWVTLKPQVILIVSFALRQLNAQCVISAT